MAALHQWLVSSHLQHIGGPAAIDNHEYDCMREKGCCNFKNMAEGDDK